MIDETLSQNALVIPSNDMTLQLYTIEYIDNRITNKFIKDTEYYRGCNHKKFIDFIDTLLSITANIPTIKDFALKEYKSYENITSSSTTDSDILPFI
jgi:gamma-glutamylcysteine synthetase